MFVVALRSLWGTLKNAVIPGNATLRLAVGPGASVLLADIDVWCDHLRVVEDLRASTVKKYRRDAADLVKFTGARSWSDITSAAIGQWLKARADAQASAKRRRNLLSCARTLCRWLKESERIARDPSQSVRVRDRNRQGPGMRPLSMEEAGCFLKHIANKDRQATRRHTRRLAFYTFLLFTAVRYREACGIKWRDIDIGGRTLTVRAELTRNRKERTVTLVPSVLDQLATLKPGGPNEPVFPRGVSHHTVKADMKAAGIDPTRVSFHSFRKSLATGLHEKLGTPLKVIAQQTGHSSMAVLERSYIQPTDSSIEDAMIALEKMFGKSLDTAGGTGDISPAVIRTLTNQAPPDGASRRGLSARFPANHSSADADRRLTPSAGTHGQMEPGGIEPDGSIPCGSDPVRDLGMALVRVVSALLTRAVREERAHASCP